MKFRIIELFPNEILYVGVFTYSINKLHYDECIRTTTLEWLNDGAYEI